MKMKAKVGKIFVKVIILKIGFDDELYVQYV